MGFQHRKRTEEPQEKLQGTIARIIFARDGFAILAMADRSVAKGNMTTPAVGMEYVLLGNWVEDPQRGPQFLFAAYHSVAPRSFEAVAKYLDANAKWIGPETARAICDAYGEDAIRTLKEDPARVAEEIRGITFSRAAEISEMLKANEAEEELQIALNDLFVGTGVGKFAMSQAIKLWGTDAPARIAANPFVLTALSGVGFTLADNVRARLEIPHDDPHRIQAGILHVLQEAAHGDGHTYLPEAEFLQRTVETLRDVSREAIQGEASILRDAGEVDIQEQAGTARFALASLALDERYIATKLDAMLSIAPRLHGTPSHEGLHADQITAVDMAMAHNVVIVTGAPGVGKTYTIERIIESYPDMHVELAAPTGKAAKRMAEMTGRPANTIHRLLEYQPDMGGGFSPTRNELAPLDADLVILDECSMIDVTLMANFLRALPTGARLVMVGDSNQLPSVGPGNVLRDLIAAGVPSVELTTIKRQDAGDIIRTCHAIKNGQPVRINPNSQDLFFIPRDTSEGIVFVIQEMVANRLAGRWGVDRLRDIQILSPRREKCGTSCEILNKTLQVSLNENRPPEKCKFAIGDKVIQTRNDYDAGLINGDIGYVVDIDLDATRKTYVIDFEAPPRTVEIPVHGNDLEHAYSLTVHTSQGSEWPVVVVPIHKSQGPMVQRNLLYTAISRAKKVCVLVGQLEEISKIVRRVDQLRRWTQLGDLFRDRSAGQATASVHGTREGLPEPRPVQPPAPPARPARPTVDLTDVLAGWTF